jgi:hypothetical protein
MTPDAAAAMLDRIFPADQCHPNPTKLMFETNNGPHNFSTVPVFNQYAYAIRSNYAAIQRPVVRP